MELTNYERIKSLGIKDMAHELFLIANWSPKYKKKMEKVFGKNNEEFYVRYLNAKVRLNNCIY